MSGPIDLSRGSHSRLVVFLALIAAMTLGLTVVVAGCGKDAGTQKGAAVSLGSSTSTANPTQTTSGTAAASGSTAVSLTTTTEGAGIATYRNDDWGFALDYPEDWKLVEILDGHGCTITHPLHDTWEITAWADPDDGKTAAQWLEEQFKMNEALFEIKRADDTLDTGIFGNSTHYAYDYWTSHVPAGDYDQIYEILVAQDGGSIYFVTGQYPVDDLKKAESPIVAVLDSLAVFPEQSGEVQD